MARDDDTGRGEGGEAGGKSADADGSRRLFLKLGIGALGAGAAAAVVVPGTAFVIYPLGHETTSRTDAFLPAGEIAQFPEGEPVKVDLYVDDKIDAWNRIENVKVGSAWVIRRGEELVAFSTVCPHLGCAIDYDAGHDAFRCPCHKSRFSKDGEIEDGPSPRGLDRLDVQVEDELVAVRYQRFKQGVEDKEVV